MTIEDFQAFYSSIHNYPPFDWQVDLMRKVDEDGWPATIALPTSSGKTSAIDIAVFHLALQAGLPLRERQAALRTFFVIDRRVVVDEAAEHAQKIALALKNATEGIVLEAANCLRKYGGELPLEVSTMRGGMFRDNSWADEPNQPLICVSTVDQTGSRLLFRGYQVGESSRPVHAGLIGNDSLIILDEAHLSTAFRDTLGAVRDRYMTWADVRPAKPLRLVEMSATALGKDTFQVDLESVEKDSVLGRRWNASKPAELRPPTKNKFEVDMSAAAKELAGGDGVSVVGVIANTVGSARAIFTELQGLKGSEAILLIGRNRPYCAQKLWEQYKDRIAAKEGRPTGSLLYVVATQTVEVGANIDFDALVTEAAPLDSLRQRFGRLNRLGRPGVAKAVIVRRKEDVVYGEPTARTWDFLREHEPVDFGVAPMDALVKDCPDITVLNATSESGPLLFPAHLEFWVQTNPTPSPDPEVAPFLHGRRALEAADVQVVWREDLGDDDEEWGSIVELAPPVATEALAMPIAAVRRWLKGQSQEIADVEGIAIAEAKEEKHVPGRKVLPWRGAGKSDAISAEGIRPGDTVVVPCSYGGADEFGWSPGFLGTLDVGDKANNERARLGAGRPRFRVGLLKDVDKAALEDLIKRFLGNEEEGADKSVAGEIEEMLPERFKGAVKIDRDGKVITWPYQRRDKSAVLTPSGETDEDDESSFIGKKVLLDGHMRRVAKRARKYAEGCGLAAELVSDIVLAAECHDLGKRDERFQSWLHGRLFGEQDRMIAKSGDRRPRAEDMRLRDSAGYPEGARHEAGSVVAAGLDGILRAAHDRELVLYLIGVHHGYGRPLFPVWEEPSTEIESGWELARIDSGWVDRFWSLNRKYGYWVLAYLEAILRRADCMESRREERRGSN